LSISSYWRFAVEGQLSPHFIMSYPEYDIDIDETVEDFTDDYEYQAYPSEKAQQQQQYYGGELGSYGVDPALGVSADKMRIQELETQYGQVIEKYKAAMVEVNQFKNRKATEEEATNAKVKQLEERVTLIKNKAKEKIAEQDQVISEQNEKIGKYEEMLALLEMNCKQAILKFNEAQAEVTKREEMFQQHLAFKNRYDYTVSYLEEKSRKIQEDYKKIIQNMQEEFAKQSGRKGGEELMKEITSKVGGASLPGPADNRSRRGSSPRPSSETSPPKRLKPEPLPTRLAIHTTLDLENSTESPADTSNSEQSEESKLEEKVEEKLPKLRDVKITLAEAMDEFENIDVKEGTAKDHA